MGEASSRIGDERSAVSGIGRTSKRATGRAPRTSSWPAWRPV